MIVALFHLIHTVKSLVYNYKRTGNIAVHKYEILCLFNANASCSLSFVERFIFHVSTEVQ